MNTEEMIVIMQAYVNGADIIKRNIDGSPATNPTIPPWDWVRYTYEVKPELKTVYINEYRQNNSVHSNKEHAIEMAAPKCIRIAVKYREMFEDEN